MPSPFPGMDPYLEEPSGWHPFHTKLVAALADALNDALPDDYYAQVEQRTLVATWEDQLRVGQPDALVISGKRSGSTLLTPAQPNLAIGLEVTLAREEPMHERYLEIRHRESSRTVVAAVEVLSYSNKLPGRDRDRYLQKRGQILASRTSLVEIDLLRTGARMPGWEDVPPFDYGVIAAPGYRRPDARLFGFTLRETVPAFSFPLDGIAVEPALTLGLVLSEVYRRGRYHLQIDYHERPDPPLPPEDEAWADALLRERGLR